VKLLDADRSVKTVVVLGAGATRGASFAQESQFPPFLDDDFFELAQKVTGEERRVARRLLERVYQDFGTAAEVGMEEFFTHVEFCAQVHQQLNVGRGRKRGVYLKAAKDFKQVLRLMLKRSCERQQCSYHQELAGLLRPGDTIISFNYDTVIDRALVQVGGRRWRHPERYGVPVMGDSDVWEGSGGRGRPYEVPVRLLKLHGSTHWDRWDETKSAVVLSRDDYGLANPLIVPPAWNKGMAEEAPFPLLWKAARRALHQARALVLIGYSLPSTDLLFRALLALDTCEGMSRHRKLRYLYIANPTDDDVTRLRALLARVVDAGTDVRRFHTFKDLERTFVQAAAQADRVTAAVFHRGATKQS